MLRLADLFAGEEFRFRLTLRRGDPAEFFGAQDATGIQLAERTRWLVADPRRYAALTNAARPLLAEFVRLCESWKLAKCSGPGTRPSSEQTLVQLGKSLETDFLLLSPDSAGNFRLRGGVLSFPTGWSLTDKLGQTLGSIHGVVPGLNAALESPINQFLGKLKPGVAFFRDNWGIAASPELNLHPSRNIAAPQPGAELNQLWLRVEHQALVALPESAGVVFGIRVALHRLDEVINQPEVAAGLQRELTTMPASLIAYKRLDGVLGDLLRQLSRKTQ